ncbi:hypothetical protein A3L12_05755 [Thermococcus sp. P6]|uniref:CGP-CTERM sorting domain-containing protein n=1 Tax=Thermococcus sp. P6 TaxID=122420 RepID=UPI000B599B41|nr:CGP-CTERM sorting domain-containing protein [Thermococcus sp. P6]ASJ10840.1 hypothetical protein A3L12_05755 [Thermococcus sp. P6]
MKRMALLFTALLMLSTVSYALAEAGVDPNRIHFYMYGMATCPHCKRMKEEIPEIYGENSLTYYELLNNDENERLFSAQYNYTGIAGVPAIGIAYDGKLVAIVEGEYNVSATPDIVRTALENNGLLLFVGGKAYIIKNETVTRKLQEIYVEHRLPGEDGTKTPGNGGTCGPGTMVALALLPVFLRKRR